MKSSARRREIERLEGIMKRTREKIGMMKRRDGDLYHQRCALLQDATRKRNALLKRA